MNVLELVLLALGLSMDAFAVSVCKGLAVGRVKAKHLFLCGIWFGGFQALMPFIGYLLGSAAAVYIEKYDHWVAFGLLVLIGAGMIREALGKNEEEVNDSFALGTMFLLALATSIDALVAGIPFGMMPSVNLPLALSLIGGLTFLLSAVGVKIGSLFGTRYKFAAEMTGGIALILLGTKILLEGLGVLA